MKVLPLRIEAEIVARLDEGRERLGLKTRMDALDVQSLRELVCLIRDLDHEKHAAVNRARMMPRRR